MIAQGILTQLGYSVTPNSIEQAKRIIANTKGFSHVEKHLINLHDKIQSHLGFVGLSGSKDYFKIKNTSKDDDIVKLVEKTILNWAEKYKITIQKVPNKQTYYVIGYEH